MLICTEDTERLSWWPCVFRRSVHSCGETSQACSLEG